MNKQEASDILNKRLIKNQVFDLHKTNRRKNKFIWALVVVIIVLIIFLVWK